MLVTAEMKIGGLLGHSPVEATLLEARGATNGKH